MDERERAAVLYRMAAIRYEDGEYEAAVDLLREAIELYDLPGLHHNLGRALHQLGRLTEARDEYQIFLEREPDAPQRPQVEARIEAIERRLAAESAEESTPSEPESITTQPRARRRVNPWPWVLVGVGSVALGTGIAFAVLFDREVELYQAPETTHLDAIEAYDRAETFRPVALSTLIVGACLMASGIVWGIVDLVRRRRPERP